MALSRSRWLATSVAATTLLAGSLLTLRSSEAPQETSASDEPAAESARATAAMRAFIDPETGELTQEVRPSPLDKEGDLTPALDRSHDGLVEVRHPDGHVSVDLQGRFQSATVARIGSDGEIETGCFSNAEPAETFRCDHDHDATTELEAQ